MPTAELVPAAAGVRAQAVLRDGTLVDDFLIRQTPRAVHVLNAPSPVRYRQDREAPGQRQFRDLTLNAEFYPPVRQALLDELGVYSARFQEYARDVLAGISIPALLVYGGASNFYSAGTAQYVRDSIPNAVLHTYPDVDHAPHLWERERFVGDVLDFVAGGAGGKSR